MERAAVKVGRLLLGILLLGGAGYAIVNRLRPSAVPAARDAAVAAPPVDSAGVAPAGVRIRVRVTNATDVRGLGRRAMLFLRDRGFDVVELGTDAARLDSTVVLDHAGRVEWGKRALAAMGGGQLQAAPDSSRDLDLTVRVGRSWRPPAQPFYP